MKKLLQKTIVRLTNLLPAKLKSKLEYKRQTFIGLNERPIEYSFVFKWIGMLSPAKVLDVGTGTTALPHLIRNCGPLVTAIDNISDYWPAGMSNRHYYVLDKDITASTFITKDKFDLITCISVIEHIKNHDIAIKNMFLLLKEGGHLILTCPYTENEYMENVYELPESNAFGKKIPFVCQSYSKDKLNNWLKDNGGKIIEQEFWQLWNGDYWSTGNKIIPPRKVGPKDKHQITCILIRKNVNES